MGNGLFNGGDGRLQGSGIPGNGIMDNEGEFLFSQVIELWKKRSEILRPEIESIDMLPFQADAMKLVVVRIFEDLWRFIDCVDGGWFSRMHSVMLACFYDILGHMQWILMILSQMVDHL